MISAYQTLLTNIENRRNTFFSGIGLLCYDNGNDLERFHCDLLDNAKPLLGLNLGSKALEDYLLNISDYRHPYHDGFHLINANGQLTHVAQFLSPPVIKSLKRVPGQGARTFCSQCISAIKGVLLVGSISTKGKILLYKEGSAYEIEKKHDHPFPTLLTA